MGELAVFSSSKRLARFARSPPDVLVRHAGSFGNLDQVAKLVVGDGGDGGVEILPEGEDGDVDQEEEEDNEERECVGEFFSFQRTGRGGREQGVGAVHFGHHWGVGQGEEEVEAPDSSAERGKQGTKSKLIF